MKNVYCFSQSHVCLVLYSLVEEDSLKLFYFVIHVLHNYMYAKDLQPFIFCSCLYLCLLIRKSVLGVSNLIRNLNLVT